MAPSKRIFCAALFFVSISFCLAASAKAQTLFSNFGPGQSYNSGTLWVVGTEVEGESGVLAVPFVPSETATLSDVMAALGEEGSVDFYVESDSGGEPGAILDTLTTTGTIGSSSSILTYTCSSCSELTSGTTYFLVAVSSPVDGYSAWNDSNSDVGSYYYNGTGSATGPWTLTTSGSDTLPAFEVDGTPLTPTPEPPSQLLFGTGLLGFAAFFSLRRRLMQNHRI
jgi:PEP-CTERM motif